MGIPLSLVTGGAQNAALQLVSLATAPKRGIIGSGVTINVMCAVREQAVHELKVTQHPVEQGANIADHAYVMPVKVILQWDWSDSYGINGGGFGYSKNVYENLLALQTSRQPFDLYTGKKVYEDMVITMLDVPTTKETENSLKATIHCQQVLIVSAESTTVGVAGGATSSDVPSDPSVQADPEVTQPAISTGNKSAVPSDFLPPSP